MFTSRIITILCLTFGSTIHFKLILYMLRYNMDQNILGFVSVFAHIYSIVPTLVVEKTILFPWNHSFTFVRKSIVHICVGLFLDPLFFSLIYLSILMAIPHNLVAVTLLKVFKSISTSPLKLFFFKVVLSIINCFTSI